MTLALATLATGVAISVAASNLWSDGARARQLRAFNAEATAVGLTMTTSLRHMDDLAVAARTLVATNPALTNSELARWYRSMGAGSRFPGALGFGYIESVPASGLADYRSSARADPVPGFAPFGKNVRITPPGDRPSYCLIRLAVTHAIRELDPRGPGYDLCAAPGASVFLGSAESAAVTTVTASLPKLGEILLVTAPVYRGGSVPRTPALREARMLGWLAAVFDVRAVLGAATAGDRGLAIAITWRKIAGGKLPASSAGRLTSVARVGHAPAKTPLRQSFSVSADGNWTVTVARAPAGGFRSPSGQGDLVLAGGILITVLIVSLGAALGGGRLRALRMVEQTARELRHQALHDPLTGLPNRTLILDRVQQLMARTRRVGSLPAILVLDLDDFKTVNDTFGHPAGDELLGIVAERLSSAVRDADTIGRLGGDEFVVLLETHPETAVPELVAQRLLDELRRPLEVDGEETVTMTASIGVAVGDRPAAEDLLRDADIALYAAKEAGRRTYTLFDAKMGMDVHDKLALELDLRGALERGEFFLAYQPIFDLDSGEPKSAEALLRWQHPRRGVIPPAEFVPIAESTGLILPIGAWVLETACAEARRWHEHGSRLNVCVNVSAVQLNDPSFADMVAAALDASGLAASALILEVTESALVHEPTAVSKRLSGLKKLGVRLAIDDFGTGHSSLAYLQQLPVDRLKIDKSFVDRIATSIESRALIRTVVQLGRDLGLRIVAEGIETEEQRARLRTEGCDLGQGYLLARPLTPEDLFALVEQERPERKPRMAAFARLPALARRPSLI